MTICYLFFNLKMSVTSSESRKVPHVTTMGNKCFEWKVTWYFRQYVKYNTTNRIERVQTFKMLKNQKLLKNNLNTGIQTIPMFSII